jgi:hypothetical protein
MPRVVRHLVVDNEAAAALLSTRPRDPKRAEVVLAVAAANGRRVAPTAVRCEADWRRSDPAAANANRLVPADDPLDRGRADRAVELRRATRSASLVDAAVAVAAERLAGADVVEILTSDPDDLEALAGYLDVRAI